MRMFLALPLPTQVVDEAQARLAPTRRDWPDLRWVASQRWHLTLAFLGDVTEAELDALRPRVLRVSARHSPVRLRLESAGRFDQRVLWLGIGGDRAALRRLSASLSAAARRVGIPGETGRYRPHLTVARARTPVDLAPVVAGLQDGAGPWFVADHVTLFASRIGATVEHTAVDSWRLATPIRLDA
jgi:2'-5' RNA ligase